MSRKQKKRIDRYRERLMQARIVADQLQAQLEWERDARRTEVGILNKALAGYKQILRVDGPRPKYHLDMLSYTVDWSPPETKHLGPDKVHELVSHALTCAVLQTNFELERARTADRFTFTRTPEGLRPCPPPR